MEKLEKCIKFDQQCEPLRKKFGLTYWQSMKLRNRIFQDFINAAVEEHYAEISIKEYITWAINQADH